VLLGADIPSLRRYVALLAGADPMGPAAVKAMGELGVEHIRVQDNNGKFIEVSRINMRQHLGGGSVHPSPGTLEIDKINLSALILNTGKQRKIRLHQGDQPAAFAFKCRPDCPAQSCTKGWRFYKRSGPGAKRPWYGKSRRHSGAQTHLREEEEEEEVGVR
jgi:hypothetical protein